MENLKSVIGIIFFLLGAHLMSHAQCIDDIRKATDINKSSIKQVLQVDWDKDGVKDKVFLLQNGDEDNMCTQVAVLLYDNGNYGLLHGVELSSDLGAGLNGCCPTKISISKDILTIETSEMRNESKFKFRYDTKKYDARLIGYDKLYYPSGQDGPKKISVNCLTNQAIITNSKFNEAKNDFEFLPPVTKKINQQRVTLGSFSNEKIAY